jgi:histidine triad (HIT) family protein
VPGEGLIVQDCLFCKIAAKEIPATIVCEDDQVVAFEDIEPQAPVHILVIPRAHIANASVVGEADRELVGHLVVVAARVAGERGVNETGYRLVFNSGPDAGQAVDHLHLHVLGGRGMSWPPG